MLRPQIFQILDPLCSLFKGYSSDINSFRGNTRTQFDKVLKDRCTTTVNLRSSFERLFGKENVLPETVF